MAQPKKQIVRVRPKRESFSADDLLKEINSLRDEIEQLNARLYLITQQCAALETRIEDLESGE